MAALGFSSTCRDWAKSSLGSRLTRLGSDSDGVGSGLPDKTRGCVDGLHEAIRTRTGGGALIPIIRT